MDSVFTHLGLDHVEGLAHDAHLARRREDGTLLVIRLLPWHMAWTEELTRRGPQLCALRHPSIARVHTLTALPGRGQSYLVREYVPGRDAQPRGAPLPTDLAVYLGLRLAEALAFSGPRVGPHRRLAPSHVLLSVNGEVKLIGFEDAHVRHVIVGSGEIRRHAWLPYISPEELRESSPDTCTDVYGVGACLWAWLVGHAPFSPTRGPSPRAGCTADDLAALHAIVHGTVPPLDDLRPELPATLRALVARAMAPDPGDRHPRLEDLHAALSEALDCDLDLARHALAAWVGADAPQG